MCDYYVEILLICNFHPSRARNYATTIISKLNNFAEVLAVRVHVDVYMATAALRSLTHETLCDTGQRTADTLKFTNHHLTITKSLHFKPSILVFFAASPQKIIDGKNAVRFCSFLSLSLHFEPSTWKTKTATVMSDRKFSIFSVIQRDNSRKGILLKC